MGQRLASWTERHGVRLFRDFCPIISNCIYIHIYIYGNRLNHKMTFQKVKMLVYQSTLYLSSRDCSHSQSVIDHYSPKDYIQSIEAWGSIGLVCANGNRSNLFHCPRCICSRCKLKSRPTAFHTPQPQPLPLPGKR